MLFLMLLVSLLHRRSDHDESNAKTAALFPFSREFCPKIQVYAYPQETKHYFASSRLSSKKLYEVVVRQIRSVGPFCLLDFQCYQLGLVGG